MKEIVIIGYGGHAKSLLDTIETVGKYRIAGIVKKNKTDVCSYHGYKIIGTDSDWEQIYLSGIQYACMGIGYLGKGSVREELYIKLKKIGFTFPPIIDPTSIVSKNVLIGEGSYIGKRVVINTDTIIGKMAIINTGAIIEHNCIVNDFSHIAVAAVLCGGVKMGKGCLIGANAVVCQGIKTGDASVVGAGAVVIKNVSAHSTVAGIPANIIISSKKMKTN